MNAPPTPTDRSDTPDFEDRLRAMLAERAADVRPADVSPEMPSGVRIALREEHLRRRPRGASLVAVAAALVVLVGAGVLVAARADDDGRVEQAGTTAADDGRGAAADGGEPAPARPDHLASLPEGIDPTVGDLRSIGGDGPAAEDAARAALDAITTSDLVPLPVADRADDVQAMTYRGAVDGTPPDASSGDGDGAWRAGPDDALGTVTVRRGDDGQWTAVALTADVIDMSGLRYGPGDGGLRGEVRASVPAPMRVRVETLEGEQLGTSDLTNDAQSGLFPAVLNLDELLERTDGQPIVVQVEVGDRPGQVGIGGVQVVALASVVLPGWGADDGTSSPTASTTPVGPGDTTTSVAAGAGVRSIVWPAAGQVAPASPVDAVTGFFADVTGLGVTVEVMSGSSTSSRWEGTARLEGDDGVNVDVVLVPTAEGWGVAEVGGGGVDWADGELTVTWPGPSRGDVEGDATLLWTLDREGVGSRTTLEPGEGLPDLDDAAAVVAVRTDAAGRVVDITGNPLV